jgi:membrane protein implicated in regulation of membrane protease activity
MISETWQIWLIAGLLLLIAEMFTPAFFMASLAVGCFFAVIPAAFDASLPWQLLMFSGGTLVGYFGARPFLLKYASRKEEVRTNVEALLGRKGMVIESSDPVSGFARVLVEGDDWRALAEDGSPLLKGERVEVIRVEGTLLTVVKL